MVCLLASEAGRRPEGGAVEDFGLLDHQGAFRQLSYHWKDSQTKAIVLFSHGVDVLWCASAISSSTLWLRPMPPGSFWLLNANAQDAYQDLQRELKILKSPCRSR